MGTPGGDPPLWRCALLYLGLPVALLALLALLILMCS